MKDFDKSSTFDSFVVGPANRLASAAAKRAAESPGTAYNPLFIYSASGLGKSHILSAVAHHARKANEDLTSRYVTLEAFLQELESALETGDRDGFQDRYRALDILLVDDIQFLTGQPEAQEFLLATLDALTSQGSQVVLASDRPPSEIDELDARLVSRFSGGLIVDISAPELETRMAIIHRKVSERGQTLEPGVAEAIARFPFRNIRELGGALNRVLATQELEERRLVADDIPGLIGRAVPGAPDPPDQEDDAVFGEIEEADAGDEEPEWIQRTRAVARAAEDDGYSAARVRGLLEQEVEPEDWREKLDAFERDVERLGEVANELTRLGNPWKDTAPSLVTDPDRLEEAESLLESVRERVRPFRSIPEGPGLEGLDAGIPLIAVKAAAQVVGPERPDYSPLYLWARSDDGPVDLLAAAGRTYALQNPDARIAITTVKEFSDDFVRALGSGVAGAWRERWWTVDLLLVDGVETLSETERAQDEFFHLFEALKRRGARVILAADRPPSEVHGVDERLRSRFEGGLALDVTGVATSDGPASTASGTPAAGGAAPQPQTGEDSGTVWSPSPEDVVWIWPRLDERLVETLD